AKSDQRASGNVADYGEPCRRGSLSPAEDESAELVFRFDDGDELLGQRPAVSPHAADFADFRVARSDAAGGRRRPGRAMGAALRESARSNRRPSGRGAGPAGQDPGGPLADGHGGDDTERHWRWE